MGGRSTACLRGVTCTSGRSLAQGVRIGVSGWTYAPWRGVFYPKGLPQKRELEYAAQQFRSIEINGTFYGMQRPGAFASWAMQTPDDFVFAVKGPRFITHMKRLLEAETPLANFIASGLLRLGPKLGPILWQFPPNFTLRSGTHRGVPAAAAARYEGRGAPRPAARQQAEGAGLVESRC